MTPLLWILLSPSATALPADYVAQVDLDSTASDMLVAPGGELAAFVSGTQILILDLETWETTTVAGCSGATPMASYDRGSAWAFYTGCSDGSVVVIEVDDDGVISLQDPVYVSEQEILALTVSTPVDVGQLYVLAAQEDGNPQIYLGAQDGSETFALASESSGNTLGVSGVESTLLLNSYWMVFHGGQQVSKIALSNGAPSILQPQVTNTDYVAACAPLDINDTVFAADKQVDGRILSILPAQTNNEVGVVLSNLETPLDITCSVSPDDGDWVAYLSQDTLDVRENVNTAITSEPLYSFELEDLGLPVLEEVAAAPGYLLGLSGGSVYVFTDRPWLGIEIAEEGPFTDSDTISLTLTSDTEGSYTLRDGVEIGTELASGDFEDGSASLALSLADLELSEGSNRLFLVQEDGRIAVDIDLDTPPDQPVVSLGFEDSTILVNVDGGDEPDLATYEVYVSTVEFTVDDLPEYEGPDELENPIQFTVEAPGSDQTLSVEGVTNYQTYYVGVRALDDSAEGPMSEIQTVTPEPTFSASQLANEPGGFGCSNTSGGAGLFGVLLGALALSRRRRRGLGLGALLLVSAPAIAQDDVQEEEQDTELHAGWTAKSKSNHVRVGPAQMNAGSSSSNDAWESVYNGQITMVELGGSYQFFRFLSADARLGLMRKQGNQVSTTGSESTSSTRMNVLPLGVGATLRLDPFIPRWKLGPDQYVGMPIVPWIGASLDYYPWLERSGALDVENLTAFERTAGGKAGYSWAVGGDLLLDWMDPKRASLAQARWGIVDTYLTVSYRQSTLFSDEGLSFAGGTLSFGLKIDRK
ncbi:MAG: MYXO-CTERM domain-containing protein [Cognaticolwellia sp.]|jgi:MYXO-CTERM domain-containing protein